MFLKEYFSTKISTVKKFLIISDNLSEKRNVYNHNFLLWITMQITAWKKMIGLKYKHFFQGDIAQY